MKKKKNNNCNNLHEEKKLDISPKEYWNLYIYISWLSQLIFLWYWNSGELVKTVKSEIVEEEYVEEGDPLSMKAGNIVVVVVVAMYALRVQSSC